MNLERIFERLWNDYTSQNPSARSIHDLFSGRGESVQNDHIAFRTSLDRVDQEKWKSKDLIFAGNLLGKPSFETYEMLRDESEYAAWLYVHGFRANHFTVSINSLKGFGSIEEFVRSRPVIMNLLSGSGTPAENFSVVS
jgi:hypothetical protein